MFVGSTILLCPNLAAQNGFQPPEIPRIDEIESAIQEPAQQKSFKEFSDYHLDKFGEYYKFSKKIAVEKLLVLL